MIGIDSSKQQSLDADPKAMQLINSSLSGGIISPPLPPRPFNFPSITPKR